MDADVKQIIDAADKLDVKLSQTLADVTAGRLTATVFRDLEKLPLAKVKTPLLWLQDGNVGNSGGASPKPHGSFSFANSGDVTIFPAGAFDNYFFLMTFPLPQAIPGNFVLAFDNFSVVPESAGLCQALEAQIEVRDGINVYNMAWQADQSSKTMRLFNHVAQKWVEVPSIPFPDLSKPVRWSAEFRIDRVASTTTHDVLWLNGVRYPVGVTQPATPIVTPIEMSVAFQLDANAAGSNYTAEISGMKVAWL